MKIKYFRKAKKITQEELAEKCSISLQFMGMVERGERSPSIDTLNKIADALNIKLIDLFDFHDEAKYFKIRDRLLNIVKKEKEISKGRKLIYEIFSILNEYENK